MTHTTKPQNKFKYKKVKILWMDITSSSEWMSLDRAIDHRYSFCEDIGYLLYKDPKSLFSILRIIEDGWLYGDAK